MDRTTAKHFQSKEEKWFVKILEKYNCTEHRVHHTEWAVYAYMSNVDEFTF